MAVESVRLNGTRKVYDNGFVAVRGASLVVEEGEFLVLVGPSGCGKSTLLRMIAGLEAITEGELYIGGRLVNDVAPKDRDIAMVFQNYALYPHLTVFENMAFGLRIRKYSRAEIVKRVSEAVEVLGLEDIVNSRPATLSGGQRQRVAVGRAIVRKPRVFLFDEPLSNLDAKLRVQMRAEIRKLHARLGATMIYVTHDQVEAMTMGDRIVVMSGGVIEQIDTPINLYDFPANQFVAGFIGSPSMNFFEGSVLRRDGIPSFCERGGGVQLPLTDEQAAGLKAIEGSEMTLGVRPEDVFMAGQNLPPSVVTAVEVHPDLVEHMGNEVVLHATTSTGSLRARLKRSPVPGPGELVPLAFDRRKLHFFHGGQSVRITQ
jgi:multiple sugar transport system ATP-binding protein